ncbi:MAG: U32 family peptidase [Lachnospiraceae bacterium]|nr:U32 family peptidase [Lachnospiraceae bacterium]MEE3460886.1 U32 family peptidase [Lachnospiraceae bacterium]
MNPTGTDTIKYKKPEVLAPAGTFDCLLAAVEAGADAVYLGGSRFGARAFAGNFDHDGLINALDYAHNYGRRIYLTVNTIIYEDELKSLGTYLKDYVAHGLDGVIVQDMGAVYYINRYFPELPVHISTQATITTGINDRLFKGMNVSRIVPSRELSIEEIKSLKKDTQMEVEVFVSGALCYSYSGQCLLSEAIGGRSANRGMCAGTCRLPFRLPDNSISHILSMKENNSLPMLGNLIEAGADSFKLEGRMKKPEYVAFMTHIFRKYTDKYMELKKDGCRKWLVSNEEEYRQDLMLMAELYNRNGFTEGFLRWSAPSFFSLNNDIDGIFNADFDIRAIDDNACTGRAPLRDILSEKRPSHGGMAAGIVTEVDRNKNIVTFRTLKDINAHDVLEFDDQASMEQKYEYTAGEFSAAGSLVRAKTLPKSGIVKGDTVFRTRNAALLEFIHSELMKPMEKKALKAVFIAKAGEKAELKLCVINNNGPQVSICSQNIIDAAKSRPLDHDKLKKDITASGDDLFEIRDFVDRAEDDCFIPVSVVKKMRRQAIEKLKEKLFIKNPDLISKYQEREADFEAELISVGENRPSTGGYHESSEDRADKNMSDSKAVTDDLRKQIVINDKNIVRPELLTVKEMLDQLSIIKGSGNFAIASLPHIIRKRDLYGLKHDYNEIISSPDCDGVLVRSLEGLTLILDIFESSGIKKILILDNTVYAANSLSWKFFNEHGVDFMIRPFEESDDHFEMLPEAVRNYILSDERAETACMTSRGCVQNVLYGCLCTADNESTVKARSADKAYTSAYNNESDRALPLRLTGRYSGVRLTVHNYCKYCYNEITMKRKQ